MKVSVVVASFGDDSYRELAERAVASVEGQGAWEVISLHLPGGTLAGVRNTAALAATGDWLCYLDADDELCPGYLDAMRAAEAPLALLVPAVQEVDSFGALGGPPAIPAWGNPLIRLNCAVIGTLVPRALFLEVGGFEEEPVYEDWALWLRCVTAGARLVPVPDAVYCAHVNLTSRNRQDSQLCHDTYWAIRARFEHVVALHAAPSH